MSEFIYVGGCDVGIKNLTFCFARIPISHSQEFIDKIEIDELILLNLLTSTESTQQTYTKPSCVFQGKKPCKGLVKYYDATTKEMFCQRHINKSLSYIWHVIDKPITKVHKKKKKTRSPVTIDSDEEQLPENETPQCEDDLKIRCGSCEKVMNEIRFHRYIAYPLENNGFRYLPLCISCQRQGRHTEDSLVWPPISHSSYNKGDTLLCGPAETETEVIMNNLVTLLEERFKEQPIDLMFIENQPTMMNPRMKSIQMILYAFFQRKINRMNGGRCMFVSPNLKWKTNMPEIRDNATYREHKKESVRTFLQWIDEHRPDQSQWADLVKKEKKRDDLCDAFWLMISGLSNWKISLTRLEQSNLQNDDT